MTPKLRIAAITDEFSPDLALALDVMSSIGMTGAELRVCWGKNIMDLTEEELNRVRDEVNRRGFEVMSIASPLLKCELPGAGEVDSRFHKDVFASKHTYDDQPRLLEQAFRISEMMGAKVIRVFSYWRTVEPKRAWEPLLRTLEEMAKQAAQHNVIIGIENEHACHLGTAAETAPVLNAVAHPNLQIVWDPANAAVAGEDPFPYGYSLLPKDRIAHVHAKDCHLDGNNPGWGPLGTRDVDWKGQIAALLKDGYRGYLSLETHWAGPNGDKMLGSTICGWNLRGLASA